MAVPAAPSTPTMLMKWRRTIAVGCADGFHDGDGALLLFQQGTQGALDAQTGHEQNKEPYQVQKEEKVVKKAFDS